MTLKWPLVALFCTGVCAHQYVPSVIEPLMGHNDHFSIKKN